MRKIPSYDQAISESPLGYMIDEHSSLVLVLQLGIWIRDFDIQCEAKMRQGVKRLTTVK